ncbi:hypothetical protein BCR37DRAFT_380171 [Protomyces lactucae-debilis]|uniref:Uncharacterized protein n=1 Tax=Protomyces lactucae-debilis TaxID=2754530 RepID=A0A1Y2FBU3_PROLT|nr:uncharacterized protein BCR37DRAFT_380171 [Protomyces lactucae-debilis]ORY81361.1 hypothetical protein BCR37DRAFT_380171 [Protomyces lactucae-debilis]
MFAARRAMITSPVAMAIFWPLLLLLTNILPGFPVDAHGCRQIQVARWMPFNNTKLREVCESSYHADAKSLSDEQICSFWAMNTPDRVNQEKELVGNFTGEAVKDADPCLNFDCDKCDVTLVTFDESSVLDNRGICWVPIAVIQIPRVHQEAKLNLKQGKCDLNEVLNRFKQTYGADMIDTFMQHPEWHTPNKTLLTIRLTKKARTSKTPIHDNVKCS